MKKIRFIGGFNDGKTSNFSQPLKKQVTITVCIPHCPPIPPLSESQGRSSITTHREGYILTDIDGENVYVYCSDAYKDEHSSTRLI